MLRVREIEDKFDVPTEWVMPESVPPTRSGVGVVDDVRLLDSSYFDTPSEGLRLFGITLRRRTGGEGTGWQLKVPNGTSRIELQSGSSSKSVPRALADALTGVQAGEDLLPAATMSTTRTVRRVMNADGELVVEIADDAVQSTRGDESTFRSWREVEVELGPAGRKKDLRSTGEWLRAAGATPGASRNKLERAFEDRAASSDRVAPAGTVGELVSAYIATQCEVIACNDIGLRTGEPLVHKTRVAVRRLRSTLRVFSKVVDAQQAAELNDELVWYAALLGQVRDCDVLADRLARRISELPAEQILGPVSAHVERTLALDRKSAWDELIAAMGGDRYRRFVHLLRIWRSAPPLTDAAADDASRAGGYVDRADRKANKRLRNADGDVEQLHRARRAMKRWRYAAELVEPADPALASTVKIAKGRQTSLGEHQDAVVAADFLARLGAAAGAGAGQNGFTYGVLMANELHHAASIRADLG